MAGSSRLDQIRASMAGDKLAATPDSPAVAAPTGQKDASVARLDEIRASMRDKQAGDASAS
jgi:hypothetical protein